MHKYAVRHMALLYSQHHMNKALQIFDPAQKSRRNPHWRAHSLYTQFLLLYPIWANGIIFHQDFPEIFGVPFPLLNHHLGLLVVWGRYNLWLFPNKSLRKTQPFSTTRPLLQSKPPTANSTFTGSAQLASGPQEDWRNWIQIFVSPFFNHIFGKKTNL